MATEEEQLEDMIQYSGRGNTPRKAKASLKQVNKQVTGDAYKTRYQVEVKGSDKTGIGRFVSAEFDSAQDAFTDALQKDKIAEESAHKLATVTFIATGYWKQQQEKYHQAAAAAAQQTASPSGSSATDYKNKTLTSLF